jgi:hypothetical protein
LFFARLSLEEEGGGKKVKKSCAAYVEVEKSKSKKLRAGERFLFSRELLFFTSKTNLKPREKSTRMEETRGKFVLHRCI